MSTVSIVSSTLRVVCESQMTFSVSCTLDGAGLLRRVLDEDVIDPGPRPSSPRPLRGLRDRRARSSSPASRTSPLHGAPSSPAGTSRRSCETALSCLSWTAGDTPWAENITRAPSGTSSSRRRRSHRSRRPVDHVLIVDDLPCAHRSGRRSAPARVQRRRPRGRLLRSIREGRQGGHVPVLTALRR